MVRCMIHNGTEEHVAELTMKLKQFLKEQFPQASCELAINAYYWKFPEDKEVIYEILGRETYGVSRFIKVIPIAWNFRGNNCYEVTQKKTFHNENAIWSKNVHPEESFLMPEITWVHIYTWPEENVE